MSRVRQARRPGKRQRFVIDHASYDTMKRRQAWRTHAERRGLDFFRYECPQCGTHTWEVWTSNEESLQWRRGVQCGRCKQLADNTNFVMGIAAPRPYQHGGLRVIADATLDEMLETVIADKPPGFSWDARSSHTFLFERASGKDFRFILTEKRTNRNDY
jgi:hypothetical protein